MQNYISTTAAILTAWVLIEVIKAAVKTYIQKK